MTGRAVELAAPWSEMAFQGSLKELPLPDIIQLVSVSGKTGMFTLARESEKGFIYLRNGQMVHAEIGELVGEEAIYALAIWNHGDFQFTAAEEPQRQTITKSNTNLLMEAARRIDEWRVLSKKISSIELVPELHPREDRHEQITLNPQEWRLVTWINGDRSISEIGKLLDISSFEVAKVLYGMITSELVVLKKKRDPIPDPRQGELTALAARIRALAEEMLGSGHKSIERHYRSALEGIESGGGVAAIETLIVEIEKTASLLRGLAITQELRSRISQLTSSH